MSRNTRGYQHQHPQQTQHNPAQVRAMPGQHHQPHMQRPPQPQQNAQYSTSMLLHQQQVKRLCDDLVLFYKDYEKSKPILPPPEYKDNPHLADFLQSYTSLGYRTNAPSPQQLLICETNPNPSLTIGHGSGDMITHLLLDRVPDTSLVDPSSNATGSVFRYGINNIQNVSPAHIALHDEDSYEKLLQASLGISKYHQSMPPSYQTLTDPQNQQLSEYQKILYMSIRYPRPAPTMVKLISLNTNALTIKLNQLCARHDLLYEQSIHNMLVEVVKSSASELTSAVVQIAQSSQDVNNAQASVSSHLLKLHFMNRTNIVGQHNFFQSTIDYLCGSCINITDLAGFVKGIVTELEHPQLPSSPPQVLHLTIDHLLKLSATHPFWKRNLPLLTHIQSFK